MKKNRTRAFSILLIMAIMLAGIPYANATIDEKYVMADRICSRQYDSVDGLPPLNDEGK